MARLETPDLRKMLVELAYAVNKHHPGAIIPAEIDRIKGAENVLLVLSRVIAGLSKRHAGVTSSEIRQAADKAKWVPDSADVFDGVPLDYGVVTGRTSTWDVLHEIDKAMHDPKRRTNMPDWFLNNMWPGILRRVAQGKRMTERERSIALYVISIASGER